VDKNLNTAILLHESTEKFFDFSVSSKFQLDYISKSNVGVAKAFCGGIAGIFCNIQRYCWPKPIVYKLALNGKSSTLEDRMP
jgi:hypothetical protein